LYKIKDDSIQVSLHIDDKETLHKVIDLGCGKCGGNRSNFKWRISFDNDNEYDKYWNNKPRKDSNSRLEYRYTKEQSDVTYNPSKYKKHHQIS